MSFWLDILKDYSKWCFNDDIYMESEIKTQSIYLKYYLRKTRTMMIMELLYLSLLLLIYNNNTNGNKSVDREWVWKGKIVLKVRV